MNKLGENSGWVLNSYLEKYLLLLQVVRHGGAEDQPLQGEVEDVVVAVVLARLALGDGLEEGGHLRPVEESSLVKFGGSGIGFI